MKNIQLNGFDWNGFYIYGIRYSDDWCHMDLLIRKAKAENVENRQLHLEFASFNETRLKGNDFNCRILGLNVSENKGCNVHIDTDKGVLDISCSDIMLV